MQDSHRKLIYLIVAIFTLLQVIILLLFGYTPYPDSNGYILLAQDSLKFNELYPIASKINDLAFIWNIGAINAVFLTLKLFGSIKPLLFLYALMKGMMAWFIYDIGKLLFNEKVAFITLILFVIYPANYGECTSLLSELPFIFFILFSIDLALHNHSLFGGILMAFGNWFRPMGLVFLLTIIIYFIIVNRKKILPLISGYLLIILLIGSLTYLRTGYFIYQAKTGWMALLQYSLNNSHSSVHKDYILSPNEKHLNSAQKDAQWRSECIDWIISHPKDYFAQMPNKLVKTYVSDNTSFCTYLPNKTKSPYLYEEVSMKRLISDFPSFTIVQWITSINLIYYYLVLLLFLAGAIDLIKQKDWQKLSIPFLSVIIGTAVLLFFGHGETRFSTFHYYYLIYFLIDKKEYDEDDKVLIVAKLLR
jgi:hypothetical protein